MNAAIIVAAGAGKRMGGGTDKLFLEVGGLPVVGHAWRRFDRAPCIDEIVLVIRMERRDEFAGLAKRLSLAKPYRFVSGGAERQDSVANGLDAVSTEAELVAIQDGARPCTTEATLVSTLVAAREYGAAVAAQPMVDTVKESTNGETIARHLDRSRLWAVQTPQCFRLNAIRRALAAAREQGLVLTDDTAACELVQQPVHLVVSHDPNPKLTRPEDVPYLEWLLSRQRPEV